MKAVALEPKRDHYFVVFSQALMNGIDGKGDETKGISKQLTFMSV